MQKNIFFFKSLMFLEKMINLNKHDAPRTNNTNGSEG